MDKERLKEDARVPLLPRADNGNTLWIQLFHECLNPTGRAGFVMASSVAASEVAASVIPIKPMQGVLSPLVARQPGKNQLRMLAQNRVAHL